MTEVVVHRLPTVRWWMLVGLFVAVAVSFQQMSQPDYNTDTRATLGDLLWVAVPSSFFIGLLAWRMLRSRIETSHRGLRLVRVLATEELSWTEIAAFEVRPTTNRGGFQISARHANRRLTKLGTIPGRSAKRRAQADEFASRMETERRRHGEAPETASELAST